MKRIITTLLVITIFLILLPQAMADLNDGLVAYWPFNGNANDESGNGNDGVVFGATLCDDRFGNKDSAYCFDGVDDYINIGNNVKPPFPITVSTWIRENNDHLGKFFCNDYNNDRSNRYGLLLEVRETHHIWSHTFEGFSASWNRVSKYSNDPVLTVGKWHHYAVVFNSHNDIQLYLDGAEVDGVYEGTGSSMQYSNSGEGLIGKIHSNNFPFNGAGDDIRVYSRALSENEIQQLFSGKCSFVDVPPGYWAEEEICKIYDEGITTGCSKDPLKYCPLRIVNRAQMAVFLERGINDGDYTPPPAIGIFDDVPVNFWAADWIEQLYKDGITTGCTQNPPKYCPDRAVNRAQMAVFLLRAKYGKDYEPPIPIIPLFTDVPVTHWGAGWIEQLYKEGITTGCSKNPLKYCPLKEVNRAQMAVFLSRTFGL